MLTHLCVASVAAQRVVIHTALPSHVYIKYKEISQGAFCFTYTGNFSITRNTYFDFDEVLRNIAELKEETLQLSVGGWDGTVVL